MSCFPLARIHGEWSSDLLLKFVSDNDLTNIEYVAGIEENLISYEYKHPYKNNTIFIIACDDKHGMENVNADTIKKLISLGASCTKPSKNDFWEPIHYTALNANKTKMQAVLDYLSPEELNSLVYCSNNIPQKICSNLKLGAYSNNALSVLLKYGNREKDFYECCELLILAGINVDQKDSEGVSPACIIRESEDDELLRILQSSEGVRVSFKMSFELIKQNDEAEFLNLNLTKTECDDFDGVDEEKSSCTLLQLCCTKKLTSCVKHLLKLGADPNKTISKNTNHPIMIAIAEDCEDIFSMLLEDAKLKLPEDILITIQLKNKNYSNVDKYMELILKHLSKLDKKIYKKYLHVTDKMKKTPLHYATNFRCSENILTLLRMGALTAVTGLYDGYTLLDTIDPLVLEKFLDSCIILPRNGLEMNNMMDYFYNKKEKLAVVINYEPLIMENAEKKTQESKFLECLIKITSLTYLINHPVINTYLDVKWKKCRWCIYLTLVYYIYADISVVYYVSSHTTYPVGSTFLLVSSLILILLSELLSLTAFKMEYVCQSQTYLNMVLIAGMIYLLSSSSPNVLIAVSIVLFVSTLGIFIHLAKFTFFAVKMLILKEITLNFIKFSAFYMFPMLTFLFCFYLLRENEKGVFFQTLYDIITMFAGDPNAEYPQKFTTNPIFSHIIYIIFIIYIGIILQNLLISLAVSDLQEIQKTAEFIDKIEKAKYITNIERHLCEKYNQKFWRYDDMLTIVGRKMLRAWKIFHTEHVLIIEPYNNGCVYLKEAPEIKYYIDDQKIITHLQSWIKTMNASKEKDKPYSMKVLHERLDKIENLLQRINISSNS